MPHHELKYPGVSVFLAGKSYLVPSLGIKQFEEFFEPLKSGWTGGESQEDFTSGINTYIPIIGAALRRNYPDVHDDFLKEELDLITFGLLLRAVQNASGLKTVTPGEFKTQTPTAS